MDPDAMTMLMGDAICNIEEEENWEACQHAFKSPYEARISDEDKEGGKATSDDNESSNSMSDSNSDSTNSDNGNGEDDNNSSKGYDSQYSGNDWDEPPSDREDEAVGPFYEDYSDNDVDYYNGDIEDAAKAEPTDMENSTESDEYELKNVLEAIEEEVKESDNIDYDDYPYRRRSDWSCISNGSSRLGPRYDKHGREIPKLGSFHNSELGSLTLYTEEENDIDARLATLDRKLMIHSFKNLTLESLEDKDEWMGENESDYLPQYIQPSNKEKQDLFGKWMDNIKQLDAYVTDKPTYMEIDGEGMDYMDEDPLVLMLREEGTHWQLPTIIEATIELKN